MSEFSERLARSITNRQREGLLREVGVSEVQVALVCRALADHTLIQAAMKYAPDDGPWPAATSIGRFFHHLADEFTPPQ